MNEKLEIGDLVMLDIYANNWYDDEWHLGIFLGYTHILHHKCCKVYDAIDFSFHVTAPDVYRTFRVKKFE